MIKPDIYIDLKEKDSIIIEWLSCARQQGRNATAICLEAIAYYANTGQVMKIGGVTGEKSYEKKRFHLYAPEQTAAYEYLSGQAEMRRRVAGVVKTILRAGIEKTDTCWVIGEEDILLQNFDKTEPSLPAEAKRETEKLKQTENMLKTERDDWNKEEKRAEEDDIFSILNVPTFG